MPGWTCTPYRIVCVDIGWPLIIELIIFAVLGIAFLVIRRRVR